jgi:DNA-binding transcriptional LysR family regulator
VDFKQFQYISKVAELQNITLAAKELYVSQPSLSNYIKKVETNIGVKIFDRNTTPISLTEVGKKYVETGGRILEIYQKLLDEISVLSKSEVGRLTIGISRSRAAYMLPAVLPEFYDLYPGVKVETIEAKSEYLKEYVLRSKVDFAILPIYSGQNQYGDEFDKETIYNEQLYLISGNSLFAHDYEPFQVIEEFSNFDDMKFVLLEKGHGIRYAVDKIFEDHKFIPKIMMKTTSNETAYRLSVMGHGVAIVPEIALDMFNSKQKPYVYKLGREGERWEVAALFKKGHIISIRTRLFLDMLKNSFNSAKE